MHASHRRSSVDVAPGNGALYLPTGPVHMQTSDAYDSYALRIDRHALEDELEALREHPVAAPLALDLNLDLTRGPGAGWSRLVAVLAREATRRDSLFTRPLAAAPLHDALISGLLHTAGHRWRDELDRPVRSWAPPWSGVNADSERVGVARTGPGSGPGRRPGRGFGCRV